MLHFRVVSGIKNKEQITDYCWVFDFYKKKLLVPVICDPSKNRLSQERTVFSGYFKPLKETIGFSERTGHLLGGYLTLSKNGGELWLYIRTGYLIF